MPTSTESECDETEKPSASRPQTPPAPPVPPHRPRALTRRVSIRAWSDPYARFAWLCGIAILAAGLWAFVNGVGIQREQAQLLQSGIPIDATVVRAGDETLKGAMELPSTPANLRFVWHGKPFDSAGRTLDGRMTPYAVGEVIRIHVDPEDPEHWTPLDKPLPLMRHIMGALVILPIAVLAFLISLVLQRRIARLWRDGEALRALVVDTHTSALAPQSRAIRCTPADDEADRRMFTVFIPRAMSGIARGDTLWVLTPVGGKRRPVRAAAWFE